MEYYFLLKWIHIISATFLFGTGIGTAFFMLLAYLSKNIATLQHTTRHVVIADWLFTTPAVIIQPITGVWLMWILHYPFNSLWFLSIMGLYLLTGVCWIPVVFIQYRLHHIISTLGNNDMIPASYHRMMRWWVVLGIPAFISVMIIYWLMVTKTGLNILFSL
jgi:uncharacterized membrane protein